MPKYGFKRQTRRIEHAEMNRMLDKIEGGRSMRALVAFLYLTGARISEALAMSTEHVAVDKNDAHLTITTLKQKKRGGPFRNTRTLVFKRGTPYLDLFMNYWDNCVDDDVGRMFGFDRFQVWRAIHKVNDACSPHIFRHSRLQKLADGGANAHEIRLFAGHKRVETSTHYIEQSPKITEKLKHMID
jgi:integrase